MRTVARLLLKVVTAVSPVVIAACYGPPVNTGQLRFTLTGKVMQRGTTTGIPGIEVRCLVGASLFDVAYTQNDGTFSVSSTERCSSLEAADVDGTKNGSYVTRAVEVTADTDAYSIELDPQP